MTREDQMGHLNRQKSIQKSSADPFSGSFKACSKAKEFWVFVSTGFL